MAQKVMRVVKRQENVIKYIDNNNLFSFIFIFVYVQKMQVSITKTYNLEQIIK